MSKEVGNVKSRLYQAIVTAVALCLWLTAVAGLCLNYKLQEQLTLVALAPIIIIVGMFSHHFRLPLGLKLTHEKLTFTLTDAIVLLVACWHGPLPAIFLAGIEGFTSSRRTTRRLSSNLFSSGMMTFGAAAASIALSVVLHYGFGQPSTGYNQSYIAAASALLVASIVQIIVNVVLLSTLLALRHDDPILHHCKDLMSSAAPMFLPTSAAANLMNLGLRYDVLVMVVIGGPIFLAIYFGHRRYRDSVEQRINIMEKAHRETIEALAVAINAKDEVTHEHVLRVQIYAAGVARILGCSELEVEALKAGALLHDIGKIAVPDYILQKPGKLTAAEFEKMKIHTIAGAQILGRVEFPYPVAPVVRHHHERWDGKGYPDGLSGEQVPLTARILTVVDCFDAVREDRQYRKGMTREEAINLIMKGSGTQYDPRVVGTFIAHLPEFEAEIQAHRGCPVPTFGIEPTEQLSDSARRVAPAAGLAEDDEANQAGEGRPIHDQMKALCDLAQGVIGPRRSEDIVAAFTEKLKLVVPYDLCQVTLVMPETGNSIVVHAAGKRAELLKGRYIALGEGVTGWVIANRKPFCNTDPKLDLPPQLAEEFADCRTLAVFPIISDKEMHGAVTLYSSALAAYTQDHQSLIKEAVTLVAKALSAASKPIMLKNRSTLIADGAGSQAIFITTTGSLRMPDKALESELPQ